MSAATWPPTSDNVEPAQVDARFAQGHQAEFGPADDGDVPARAD